MKRYDPASIEPKWQKIWAETKLYEVEEDLSRRKVYATPMLPYPSGEGLHVGHVRNYSIADTIARYHRQLGRNVMSNIGWDSFGLPAENYAIQTGTPPWETIATNVERFKTQLKRLGMSYDWSREINTSDPSYYKWTQWIFLQLHKAGLAYQDESWQWWCPKCKTVLANEQVIDGCCWRHEDTEVIKKLLKQWFFKITDYAEDLLSGTDDLDWPEHIKTMQRNWIGRSIGAEIDFKLASASAKNKSGKITVFTTRPDTIFGATFLVLAPEHPLVGRLTIDSQKAAVDDYVQTALAKSDIERQETDREKSGIDTGAMAVNPLSGQPVPIWVADYVLMGYGTGAIMAVPAHDERDYQFAKKYNLQNTTVIEPVTGQPQPDPEFRKSIVAVVRNPKTDEFISINWGPDKGGHLFVGGGLEAGEDPIKCAQREIREETGYQNLKFITQTETVHHHYFAASKNKQREIEAVGLLFELEDETQTKPKLETDEQNQFSIEWLSADQAANLVKDELHAYVFSKLVKDVVYTGEGIMINSESYIGMSTAEARERITTDLVKKKQAREQTNYKIRDWLISRQRYWGAPIPIIHCSECGVVPVPEQDLPVELPRVENFAPTGASTSVLAGVEDWVNVKCPNCQGPAQRETDTMDGYACSSWYMHRYADPHNDQQAWDPAKVNYWFPVDYYFGADHAVSHLLYFRFWNHFFADLGLVAETEPVKRLVFNGYIYAADGSKMSKSKGNVVDPLEVVDSGYGADALRLFELFAAPYDQDVVWNPRGVPGTYRFLQRVWTLVQSFLEVKEEEVLAKVDNQSEHETRLLQAIHRTAKKVTDDLERLSFNTAIAAMMEFVNTANKLQADLPLNADTKVWREALEKLLTLLAPFAPHMTEELWAELGRDQSIHIDNWPAWDERLVKADMLTIVVQVNGKVRANLRQAAGTAMADIVTAARLEDNVASHLAGKELVRTVEVPNRLVNFVTK